MCLSGRGTTSVEILVSVNSMRENDVTWQDSVLKMSCWFETGVLCRCLQLVVCICPEKCAILGHIFLLAKCLVYVVYLCDSYLSFNVKCASGSQTGDYM